MAENISWSLFYDAPDAELNNTLRFSTSKVTFGRPTTLKPSALAAIPIHCRVSLAAAPFKRAIASARFAFVTEKPVALLVSML